MDAAHGFSEFTGRAVLEEIPACAGIESSPQVAGTGKCSQDDDMTAGAAVLQVVSEFKTGAIGHLDVGDDDVRFVQASELERLAAIGGLGDDRNVGLEIEECSERASEHSLIFREEHADGRSGTLSGSHEAEVSRCGSSMVRRVP